MSDHHHIPELDAAGLRNFALLTGAIIAVLFGLFFPWLLDHSLPRWPFIVGGVLAAWGFVAPLSLRPVYRGWMRFGMALSKITTPVLMTLIFALVFVPTALVLRLMSRDAMSRKFDKSASSYRVISKKPPRENLEKPY